MRRFVIGGEPKGKERPRFSRNGDYIRTYTPKGTADYEKRVREEYKRQCGGFEMFGEEAMLDLRVIAYYAIPKSVSKRKRQLMLERKIRPIKTPDADNIIKVIADSLNKTAYRDDKQIVDCMVRKFYSENPRVEVILQEVKNG